MKVILLKDVGDKKAGLEIDTNDKMAAHLISFGMAEKAIEVEPENKAIQTVPENKAIGRPRKNK